MIDIFFAFIVTYLIVFVSWFLPSAGTPEFTDPTKKELVAIGLVAMVPAIMVAVMFP